jgi:DNA-binding NtrC family response regulator
LNRPIEPCDLPLLSGQPDNPHPPARNGESFQESKSRLVTEFERQYIERALRSTSGNISAAARMGGQNRRALFELMRKHGLSPDDYRNI